MIDPVPDVHEGQRVSLVCEDASYQPSAAYTWYKDARWLGDGLATSFLLPAVTPRDMGSYVCQVQDQRGIRTSPAITLYVHCECLRLRGGGQDFLPVCLSVWIPHALRPLAVSPQPC